MFAPIPHFPHEPLDSVRIVGLEGCDVVFVQDVGRNDEFVDLGGKFVGERAGAVLADVEGQRVE